jgi:type I restriction-modification system DNA methylase subunit
VVSRKPEVSEVAGLPVGHRYAYGVPTSLLVLRRDNFKGKIVPSYIDARETHFIQGRLSQLGLESTYFFDAMIHGSRNP